MVQTHKNANFSNMITEHIDLQLEILSKGYLTFNGWQDVIHDYDAQDQFTPYSIFDLRVKCFYLHKLYCMAKHYYNTINNFKDIAKLALLQAHTNLVSSHSPSSTPHHITNASTLMTWFCLYCGTDHKFPNSSKLWSLKAKMPFFLSENPNVVKKITSFCRLHLTTLSVESVYSHIHDTIIPELVKTLAVEKDDPTGTINNNYYLSSD